jgi:LCP family protein required for cell wall assembly
MNARQIILAVCAAAIFASAYLSFRSPIADKIRRGENINILLVGTDFIQNNLHSDTLILMLYNPRTGFLDLLSIPRDTKITLAGDSGAMHVRKITESFAYYFKKDRNYPSALDALRTHVFSLLHGRIDIPFHIQLDYGSFTKLVDLLGGVAIDVEEPIKYDDYAQGLHINFKPGPQHLSGSDALKYVRFRGGAGDIGRIYRQQRFMKALIGRLRTPRILLKFPQIVRFLLTGTHKNLSYWDVLSFAFEIKNVDTDNIRLAQMPGRPYGNFWVADNAEIDKALDAICGIPTGPGGGLKITVEVLNTSDAAGAALEVTRNLRDCGFDIIDYKSLATRQPKTIVVDRVGDLRAAQMIGRIMGTDEIFTRFDSKRMVDISVYIGDDYKSRHGKR